MSYKVSEVSKLVGISVRTLHHYDQIGLLKPESISTAGYRLYQDADLERLQQILFFKELGFSLQEIKDIIDSPGFDRISALTSQKELLLKKKQRLEAIIGLVDKTLNSLYGGIPVNKKDMFNAFDTTDIEQHQKKYAAEAKEKYGHTDAYQESQRKTAGHSKDEWSAIMAKSDEIHQKLAALMTKAPTDPAVQEVIGQWRQHITDNFYECTVEIFQGLGDLYVNDPRFTANIDRFAPGLAMFMQNAMHIYCAQQTK